MDWNYTDTSRSSFAQSVLIHGGWPVSDESRVALVAWMSIENTAAVNNPLATTQPMPNDSKLVGNPAGVRNYKTWSDGIDATVKTIKNGNYPAIVAALENGTSAETIAAAVVASPWGTGPSLKGRVPQVRANPLTYDTAVNTAGNTAPGDYGAAVPEIVPGVKDPGNPLDSISSFLSLLTSWATWRRILLVVGGAAAAIVGLALIAGDSPSVQHAAALAAV
jgi:hypothetical protein